MLVGEGGFGKVFKAKHKNSPDGSRLFASKKIKYRNSNELEKVKNEISILADLSDKHIIQFCEAFYLEKSIVVVTEYLEGGELFEKVSRYIAHNSIIQLNKIRLLRRSLWSPSVVTTYHRCVGH